MIFKYSSADMQKKKKIIIILMNLKQKLNTGMGVQNIFSDLRDSLTTDKNVVLFYLHSFFLISCQHSA